MAPAVETIDHNGLRGVASVWIMVFHILVYSNPLVDLQGSTLMPLFFSLSGFSLALGYTGRLWGSDHHPQSLSNSSSSPSLNQAVAAGGGVSRSASSSRLEEGVRDSLLPASASTTTGNPTAGASSYYSSWSSSSSMSKFFYNRLIRILPVYYLCLIFAVPMTYAGYGSMPLSYPLTPSTISTFIVNILPISTWTSFFLGGPIDGPEWTIATLLFFWLCFPYLLLHFETKSDEALLNSISRCFWWNIFLGAVFFVVGLLVGGPGLAFWLSTAWPLSRIPVFIMGMNAGILCHRYANRPTMPWFTFSWTFLPKNNCCAKVTEGQVSEINFSRTISHRSIQLLSFTLLLSFLNAGGIYIGGNIWFQFLNVFAQLDLLVALCRHGSILAAFDSSVDCDWSTRSAKLVVTILRNRWWQWFGELSMSLYMVHWPCIFYACWFYHGNRLHWPSTFDCSSEYSNDDIQQTNCQDEVDAFNQARTPHYWTMPLIAIVAIGLATLLYYAVEIPVRKYFK